MFRRRDLALLRDNARDGFLRQQGRCMLMPSPGLGLDRHRCRTTRGAFAWSADTLLFSMSAIEGLALSVMTAFAQFYLIGGLRRSIDARGTLATKLDRGRAELALGDGRAPRRRASGRFPREARSAYAAS